MPDWKAEIRQRLAHLQLAPTRENAIVEELAQHLDEVYAELLGSGTTPMEASQRARLELRGSELLTHELRRIERQPNPEPLVLGTNRRSNMIVDLWQDLRFGARMLRKQPRFTLIAVLTLALGIGANTAIFGVVDRLLVRALPVHEPQRLVTLSGRDDKGHFDSSFSAAIFADYRAQNDVFAGLLAFSENPMNLSEGGQPERILGALVSGNYFDVLGVTPALGRAFLPEEDRSRLRARI